MNKFYISTYIVVLLLVVVAGTTLWYFGYHRPIIERITISPEKESDIKKVPSSEAEAKNMKQQYSDRSTHGDSNVDASDDGESSEHEISNGNPVTLSTTNKVETHPSQEATSIDPNTEEEWAKELKEIEEFSAIVRERTASVKARLKSLNERRKKRLNEKANELNSLSAEKQQAYFDNIRSGEELKEIPSNFFETLRNNLQTFGIPDEITDTFIENFKQKIQESTSEEGVRKHFEELRAHGFNPKF